MSLQNKGYIKAKSANYPIFQLVAVIRSGKGELYPRNSNCGQDGNCRRNLLKYTFIDLSIS